MLRRYGQALQWQTIDLALTHQNWPPSAQRERLIAHERFG
jgi:hypothetical protein